MAGRATEPGDQAFTHALRSAVRRAGLNQAEVAHHLGTSQPRVSQWMRGLYVPDPREIFEIEHLCGLRPGTLSKHLGFIPNEYLQGLYGDLTG